MYFPLLRLNGWGKSAQNLALPPGELAAQPPEREK